MNLRKTYKLSAIFALSLFIVAGCSNSEPDPYSGKSDLVLRVFPGSLSGSGTQGQLFFAKGTQQGKYTEIWKATFDKNGETHMDEPHYYPDDNSRLYLRGFAPQGKAFANDTVHFTIDGKTDLIASNELSGCLTDMFWQQQKEFRFSHLLSQLRFKVGCDKEAQEKGWKLVDLYVVRTQCEAALSLADKKLVFSGDIKDIEVPVEPTSLGETWTDLPGQVLVQPDARIYLTAIVVDSDGRQTRLEYLPVTIHGGGSTSVGGTSYFISVMLRAKGTSQVSAGIADWEQGGSGSVVV